ncbi:MAG TPA: AAA-associated domain-containing protein [Candidatus Binatia bacterium]|nr:AAA-associated domain-containing protein [Candidatus Binatia bacterium]
MSTPVTVAESAGPATLIRVSSLTKAYGLPGGKLLKVLEGIDLAVRSGEFVALLGRSGSGKSTLLRCIAGLIAPTGGEVSFDGKRVTACNRGTAMVFQTFALLPWLTVQQNVELGLEARGVAPEERAARALRAIDLVGLDGYESAFPKELSGGMRQRVGFARALVVEPEVLLMDEPFSALDVLTAENLRGELLELWEGKRFPTKSIVMVTHNIEEAVLLADRILILGSNPGRIREEIVNPLARPRQRRTPGFDQLVDRIYGIMTDRPVPAGAVAPARPARGTPGDTPLPQATVDGLSGLAELLQSRSGGADLADLAEILSLEVDDLLPLVDALVLLGFAALNADHLALTAAGEVFAGASIQESKRIFARAALERAPLVRTITSALHGCDDGNLPTGFFQDILRRSYGEDDATAQLQVAINWGRYAELYAFDAARDIVIREQGEAPLIDEGRRIAGRGALRVYLGAAPGAGKTFAMLGEGRDRQAAGEDVVIAIVDPRGRQRTLEAVGSLEIVPPELVAGDGGSEPEVDVAAVLARNPQTALVDDLDHMPGSAGRQPRYQDVERLRDAGINVITTLDVGRVGSVRDLVEEVTGTPVEQTVPGSVLATADEVQLVDISPVALIKRLRHGNILPSGEIEPALRTTFEPARLAALREIAVEVLSERLTERSPTGAPQDVLVAVSTAPGGEHLVGRGARLARRGGGSCTVLTVVPAQDSVESDPGLARIRTLAEAVGAELVVREHDEPGAAIEMVARERAVRHVVMGTPAPPAWPARFRRTMADRLLGSLPDLDLHILGRADAAQPASVADAGRAASAGAGETATAGTGRGALRVYLGYARGCGTTTAMLEEAQRRVSRGSDLVVAAVDTHGQASVEQALSGLEVMAGSGRPAERAGLDVGAVLARRPQVACIDDLTGPTASGESRLAAARRLVEAGLAVIATLRVADPERAAAITPAAAGPSLDESVLAAADELEFIDVPPSTLIDRVRTGLIGPDADAGVDPAVEFAPDRLAALRERALRLVSMYADRQLVAYLQAARPDRAWEVRPRILGCVPPRAGSDRILRMAADRARLVDGRLSFAMVLPEQPRKRDSVALAHYLEIGRELGGELVRLSGGPVARVLAEHARDNLVTEIIVGRRGGRSRRRHAVVHDLLRQAAHVDLHVIPVPTD